MKLFYNTVNPLLLSTLQKIMSVEIFQPFRIVGGTALSLQLGHRQSVDIDLFSDSEYGSIDFNIIDNYLKLNFAYVDSSTHEPISFGKPYFIGESANHCIKLDLFYTEKFIRPALTIDSLRIAQLEDIVAMKIDNISRGGRKKDFWDIHELLERFSIDEMINLHKERYPYAHNFQQIITNLTNFENPDNDFNPICLKGKYWELIKLDILDAVNSLDSSIK